MSGPIDEMAWVTLPNSQIATSDLSWSEPHICLDSDEALKKDPLYDAPCQSRIMQNDASKCTLTTHVSSVSLSEVATAREGSNYEHLVMKMIEVEEVSDGVNVRYTGDTMTLEKVFQCGLIPASVYVNILQRQKSCQDMIHHSTAENVPLFTPEQTEPCEVNRLILNCLRRNESLTSGRNITTLSSVCDGLSDHKTMSRSLGQTATAEASEDIGGFQGDDRLKVDACVQCDLMSSSSTLVVLGNQCQFMGLVLPHSGEFHTVSSSYRCDEQITSDEFTSRLFSDRQKIAALFIPENSEVVDMDSATQNGFIDRYTAEFLKSIEIPDMFPDVDALKEKFSSWLMYKKLTVDGCYHAADCINVENALVPSEERHLFISYLKMNSYIDPKSGQRVLILDKQLTKMVKLFLKDLMSCENTEKNVASLTFSICDLSEQVDLEIPLHTTEETEEFTQHTFHSHDFLSSVNSMNFDENAQLTVDHHSFVSSGNGRISLHENTYAVDKNLKEDAVEDFTDNSESNVSQISTFQNTIYTKSDEFAESICRNTDSAHTESEALYISTSLEMSVSPALCSAKHTNVDSPSTTCDSEPSVKACCQTLPHYDAESLCSESRNIYINPAKTLCFRGSVESENERVHAIHLLKAQLEEGGILDVTSGRRYDLEDALKKGLVDETTVLRLLDLHSDDKGDFKGEEEGPLSILKRTLSDGSISSNIALSIMEQQSLLRSDCTDSINESLQSGLMTAADNNLNICSKVSIYPEGSCSHSVSVDHNLHLINMNEAGNIQQPTDSEVTVTVLDLTNEEEDGKRELESRGASDLETRENVQETSHFLHQSTSSGCSYEPLMSSPSSRSQVTAQYIHHTDTSLLPAEDDDSQELMDSLWTHGAAISHIVTENAVQSDPSSLNDRISVSDPETQTQYVSTSFHSCNSDSPIDNDITGYNYGKEGNETVWDSELDVSSPHCNVWFEECSMGNDTIAVPPPLDSELAQSIDYSSPGDLVESGFVSGSRADWGYDENNTVDGSRIALPQQAELCSGSDVTVEFEPSCSQNGQRQLNNSPQLPVVSSENKTSTDAFNDTCCGKENSNNSVSLEAVPVNKDLLDSEHSDVTEGHLKWISPERQHMGDFSDNEQMFVSRDEKEHQNVNGDVASLNPSSVSSDGNSAQFETMREKFGSDNLSDRKQPDVHVCENTQGITDFQSESGITSDVASSAFSGVDDQVGMISKETNVSDLQKTQTEDTESTITLDQTPQPLEKDAFHERDTTREHVESSHPDLHEDSLTPNTLSLNSKEPENPELILQEERQSESPHIQLQLLQVLKTVSSSQDLSMLQEVMDTLNSALGGDSQEEQWHTLESIKEESSEGEDEGSAEDNSGPCHIAAESQRLSPQSSAKAVACRVEEVKKKVH